MTGLALAARCQGLNVKEPPLSGAFRLGCDQFGVTRYIIPLPSSATYKALSGPVDR